MFRQKRDREKPSVDFNPEKEYPAIRSSICTGEKTAGFVNRENGRFTEVMLIRDDSDMNLFIKAYKLNASEIKKIY